MMKKLVYIALTVAVGLMLVGGYVRHVYWRAYPHRPVFGALYRTSEFGFEGHWDAWGSADDKSHHQLFVDERLNLLVLITGDRWSYDPMRSTPQEGILVLGDTEAVIPPRTDVLLVVDQGGVACDRISLPKGVAYEIWVNVRAAHPIMEDMRPFVLSSTGQRAITRPIDGSE
jgi:hypothetical protein